MVEGRIELRHRDGVTSTMPIQFNYLGVNTCQPRNIGPRSSNLDCLLRSCQIKRVRIRIPKTHLCVQRIYHFTNLCNGLDGHRVGSLSGIVSHPPVI